MIQADRRAFPDRLVTPYRKGRKMKLSHIVLSAVAAVVLSGSAYAQSVPVKKADGILVTTSGMTVYTFDKDVADSGKSACNGPCATAWPPVSAKDVKASAPYSVVTRDDGSPQLAYKGKPLYLFASDKKAGDRTGDNFKDIWHVVKD
jgi:predicted lipoprotein with Yx(FWY)xxD motif